MKLKFKLLNVGREFGKLKDSSREVIGKQAAVVVGTMTEDLRAATPVDTGRARASWSVSADGSAFNVRNSAPYIQYLNQGSSKQAPAYFVERIAVKYGKPLGTIVDVVRD